MAITAQKPPTLQTERLVLRALKDGDAKPISLYVGDIRVAENLAVVPHPYPDGAAEAFIASALNDGDEMVWVMSRGGNLIGLISITLVGDAEGNVGYWLAPDHWGNGFVTESLEALVEFARGRFQRLNARVHQGNYASARVLVKCGFVYVGNIESHSAARNEVVNSWTYVLELGHE